MAGKRGLVRRSQVERDGLIGGERDGLMGAKETASCLCGLATFSPDCTESLKCRSVCFSAFLLL